MAISALAAGAKATSHRARITLVFACFLDVSVVKKVWRCNVGSFWKVFGIVKTDKNAGFEMLEH